MASLVKEIELRIGRLSVYDNNACVIEVENVDLVGDQDVKSVVDGCEENVKGDYVLISNRTHSYSTNPLELFKILALSRRLKAAAIVSYRESTKKLFPVERIIEKEATNNTIPLEFFEDLDSALNWVSNLP